LIIRFGVIGYQIEWETSVFTATTLFGARAAVTFDRALFAQSGTARGSSVDISNRSVTVQVEESRMGGFSEYIAMCVEETERDDIKVVADLDKVAKSETPIIH
jgi:hypothetical protein